MSEVLDNIQLPFDAPKQAAFFGFLLTNEPLFQQCRHHITKTWFLDPMLGICYDNLLKFHERYDLFPKSVQEFQSSEDFLKEDQTRRNRLFTIINMAVLASQQSYHLESILPELTVWLHSRVYHETLQKSTELFNKKQVPEAWGAIKSGLKVVEEISFEKSDELSFENYDSYMDTKVNHGYDRACTFGLDIMDKLILPENIAGGLLPGFTTIMLAPTDVGKTTCNITTIVANLKRMRNVLFMTHEGSEEFIRTQIWCAYLGVTRQQLGILYKTPEGRQIMNNALAVISRHLTYVPINRAGLTIEDVEPVIRRKIDEKLELDEQKIGELPQNKGYHILVSDYPAKLSTKQASKGNMPRRQIDAHVYNYYVQLGLEYKIHCLLNIQANRTASAANRGAHGEFRLLEMEDVAESFDPMQMAGIVISINKDELAAVSNRLTYKICKNKLNEKGYAIVCRSDYARGRTHGNDLGATWYRGSSPMADKVDYLLSQYMGTEIPLTELIG